MAGPFDAYLTQKKQQEAARSAAQVRLTPAQPDQVAQGLATAKELGEAPARVLAFQDHFSDLLAQKKATTALTGAPKLSEWLRTDPAGALAKDDLDNLSWWEKGLRQFADMGGTVTAPGVNALKRGTLGTGQAIQQQQAVAAQQRAGDAEKSFGQILWDAREPVLVDGKEVSREWAGPFDALQAGYRYMASRAGILFGQDEQANAVAFQQSAEAIRQRMADIPMSPGATAVRDQLGQIDGTASWGDQLAAFGQVIADDPGGFASFLAQVGAESLPGMAGAMAVGAATRSPAAAAATMGAFSGGREYGATIGDELAKSGHDLTTREGALAALQDEKLLAAATEKGKARALTIGIIDGLSGGLASKQLMASPVGDAIVQALSQAVMGGAGEGLGQLASEGRITSLSDVLVEAMAEFVTTPAEVASVGGRSLFRDSNRAQRAGSTGAIIDEVSAQAQASKVRERSPDAFKSALDRAGRGDDLLYVPAQGLREFFQARDVPFDDEMAAAWGVDLDTMAEMEMSGGRVAVPVSNFAAYLAGTDAETWLRENATLDPDEMSLAEAAQFNEAVQDDMQRAYERDAESAREDEAARASDQQVYDGIYSQLRAAGRTTDVAQNEARVMAAFFRTMAARVGEDSLDLARRFGLRIQGPDAPGIPRRRGALDVMLNDLRAGRKEKVGRTLTEFVIDAGGVQDAGGDVAALEGPRGLVGESREEIRARQTQATLDGMPATGKGLALDELGRKAVEAGYFPELMGETQGLNDGEAADLGRAVLDALREEASGRLRYPEGQGPDPARAALNAALQERGLDPAAMTNDEIAAALEADADGVTYNQGPRGSIQIPGGGVASGETIINLFETADLSTFTHEAAHFFLETLNALAADANAPQAIRDEMATVRKYLGVEDGAAFTTEQHETFARSFEAYLMEGKAPSLELADVFSRMKEWLIRIYRSVAGLNVPINDEIRGVFDRMLASDAEIAAARSEMAADPLFREKPAGMSDADWRTYQRLARRSAEDAEAALREKVMARVRREKERWWKDERKEVRKDVEAQINTEPRYRLIEAMANGQSWDGEAWVEAPDMRIDRGALVEQFGAGVLAELQRSKFGGKRAIYGEDGMTPIVAADMFGFASPADMIETLQNTGKRKDAIDAEADRIMLDRYGDPFTDGTIEREAMEAIHNEQQSNKNVVEARAIAQQLGRETRGMTARLYKQRARLMLGRMTVREAAQPARFLAAERKAGRDSERAFAKIARGDQTALAAALQAKEQQILNAALYDLSRAAEKEVAKAREKIQRFGKKSVREKLEGGYIEQIDDLLDRYDFRQRGPGAVQKSERLRDFIQRMVEDGRENELDIDDRLMDDARRVHYTKLSLDEFRGLIDTVDNLDHLGRFKQKLLNRQRQRDLDASADRIAKRVMKQGRDEMAGPRAAPVEFLRRYLNLAKTADTMMIMLDGGEEMGAVYDELKRDVTAGELLDQQMRMEMRDKLDDLYRQHYSKAEIDAMRKERMIDGGNGRAWSKLEILAVAANTGNQDNYARLIEERVHPRNRLTPEQVQALLRELDDNDWRFIQGQWDLVNSYWPQLAEVHHRRKGTKLKKVEAQQMVAAPAFVSGGYYPISYDPTLSTKAATDDASFWDRVMGGGRGSATRVQAGMTKERQSTSGGRTLKLDLGVAVEGMQKTIRVIALSEAVDNTARILRHPEVKGAFFARSLQHEYETLDLWLRDIAEGLIFNSDPLNSLARMAKLNLTTMFLAFNIKTVALQVTGLAQSAAVIGKRNLAHGMIAYLRDSKGVLQNVAEASVFMSERQRTFQKDIYDMRNDPKLASPVAGKISRARNAVGAYGFAPIQLMQFYAVDVPTWLGAYRSKIEAGVDDAVAVEYADRMVARSQDSGLMGDRAAFSRGTLSQTTRQSDIVRFWTTLGGYMITKLNRGMIEASRGAASIREADTLSGKAGAAAEMATNLTLLYVVEGLLMSLMYELWDDDDETDDMLKNVMKETGMSMVGGFPIVRDMASYLSSGFGGGGMYQTVGELPGRIWTQVQQGENDKAFRGAVSQGIGLVTGLPTTASMRVIEGVIDSDDRSWAEMFLGSNPLDR